MQNSFSRLFRVMCLFAGAAAVSACAAKETTREKLVSNSIDVSKVDHALERVASGVILSFTQTYSANYKTIKKTEKKAPVSVANFANDPVYGLLNVPFLPFILVGDVVTGFDNGKIVSEEEMGAEVKTKEGEVKNGSPVNGFLTVLDGYTNERIINKPVSLTTSGSKVTFAIPESASECVVFKFVGEIRTNKKNFDLNYDQRVGCGF